MKYCIAALLALRSVEVGQESPALSLTTHIPLPNVKGRIDHASADLKGQRLFVAAVVNDTRGHRSAIQPARADDFGSGGARRACTIDASTNRLFVACGGNGATKVYNGTRFKVIAASQTMLTTFDKTPTAKQVIAGYAGAEQLRNREAGTGGLGLLDTNGKLIQSSSLLIPSRFALKKRDPYFREWQEIKAVDLTTNAVLARWPVTAPKNNFPMSLDEAHHRLIVGAGMPPRLLVFDTGSGKQVASAELAGNSEIRSMTLAKAGST